MSCILCFLEDDFQEEVRTISQSRSERFEDVLKNFQNNFLNSLYFLTTVDECSKHNRLQPKTKNLAAEIDKDLKNLNDVRDFLNSIRDIYLTWIQGKISEAATKLKSRLDERKMLSPSSRVDKSIFFRGRKSKRILTKEELFHIPFNKRYLVQNHRYSVTGQPLLYLGLSPLSVVFELREDIDKLDDIYFCSYVHKSEDKLSVFDFTNIYPDYLVNYDIFAEEGIDVSPYVSNFDWKNEFYKFILSQICSFKRSRYSEFEVFSEEYVLPQLITEILRTNDFGGILFSSTRVDRKKCISKARFHVSTYRENLALFTKYHEENDFDHDLYNQFIISKPITVSDLSFLSIEDLKNLRRQIGKIVQSGGFVPPFPLSVVEITGTSTQTRFENLNIVVDGEEKPYFQHQIGRLHLQLVYQTVLDLRNKLKNWVE